MRLNKASLGVVSIPLFLAFALPSTDAMEKGKDAGGAKGSPAKPLSDSECLDNFKNDLKECQQDYCPSPDNCNQILLEICGQGALAVLKDCLAANNG